MKVCYVLPHFYPHVGGGEQGAMQLIQEMLKKNIQVRVITSNSGGINGYRNYNGIDIYYYDWKMLFGHPIVRKKDLEEHIKWADLVHAFVYSPVKKSCNLARKYNKASLVTVHEVLGKRWFWIEKNYIKAFAFWFYEKYIVNTKCNYFHTFSHATEKDLKKSNKRAKIKNIYCIVEEKENNIESKKINKEKFYKYFNISQNDIVFLNYGRPGKTKGVFIYLEAIRKLLNDIDKEKIKNIKFCFIMAKDPMPERKKFINKVKKYNLEDYVIIRESVSREDLENYIMCTNYVVVPSITEGFGLSAIEACNFGKKLIHSSGGSLPEVTFGSVVEFENRNSEDLKNKLKGIIENKIEFTIKPRKDFSKETITSEMIDLYNEILKNKEE